MNSPWPMLFYLVGRLCFVLGLHSKNILCLKIILLKFNVYVFVRHFNCISESNK